MRGTGIEQYKSTKNLSFLSDTSLEIRFMSGKRNIYTLFSNKKTNYRIIIGDGASESELWAANELKKYLFEISGASFQIKSDNSEFNEKGLASVNKMRKIKHRLNN